MVTDRQVRRMLALVQAEGTLARAAARAGMDPQTARKYRRLGKLPSEAARRYGWRTRGDPFAGVWDWCRGQLELNPGLKAKTLLEALQRESPGRFQDGQLRTLQRRVKAWRATEGPSKEVFFAQVHRPGALGASDFTDMTSLGVTIQGRRLEHMIYHFVLTYSNWESCTVCFSESFESLSEGLQRALGKLGAVPAGHRTDRLSAAVNNLPRIKGEPVDPALEFTARYGALLRHYGMAAEKIQAGKANENGDVEQRHHRFKQAVDQALMLRGSRDFENREAYEGFLGALEDQLNAGRRERLAEELAERYERGSVMITSNLPFSKWEGIFKDPMTTAAAIDRLVHHCVILELNIPSYRLEQAKKRQLPLAKPTRGNPPEGPPTRPRAGRPGGNKGQRKG